MSTHTASQTDVRLYHVVHEMFRRSTTRLIDATAKLEPSSLQPVIGPQWDFYSAILDHHHHTEDVSVFPALVAVRPEMRSTIDMLEDEHVELAPNIDAVESAVAAFVKLPDPSTQRAVHDALVALRDWFFPHLDLEDQKILPAIAESIPPKQWERLDKEALKSIPRKHLASAVGALDEVSRSLPERDVDRRHLPCRSGSCCRYRGASSGWTASSHSSCEDRGTHDVVTHSDPHPLVSERFPLMNETEAFVAQCASAVMVDPSPDAMREVVERAVRDRRLTQELSFDPGVRLLRNSEDLTVLHVVMPERPVGSGDPIPHNHTMWAIIGVTHGSEENAFFQRSQHSIEPLGGRVVTEGEVVVMNDTTIHSVKNPSTGRLSSALHVYGGDLIGAEKAMWCDPDLREQPFDLFRVVGS